MTAFSTIRFTNILDLADLPPNSKFEILGFDWDGEPLLTIGEGKPPAPRRDVGVQQLCDWLNMPPIARHLVFWQGTKKHILTFPDEPTPMGPHIQRFEDGWITVLPRGGAADFLDASGNRRGAMMDFGDA